MKAIIVGVMIFASNVALAQKEVSKFHSKDSTVKTEIQSIDQGSSKDVTNIGKKKNTKTNMIRTTELPVSKDVHRIKKKKRPLV